MDLWTVIMIIGALSLAAAYGCDKAAELISRRRK